ncbi:hypothetical protein HXA34_20725 [Salipaludibacillus agaradhaerens]|jgi:hypothetical protein|uniref:hypothetical protein n=1 Tax=Salipaludibacillus agaradhaerens TaxID=76935 RepID=UPI002151F517|nr:hypothetical protein [Salipaludibacillus agaradhaerens]MCR6108725.1 hypothetical protein [Salipaludibacillus agaradhaerens]MCR6120748.1 hypothetical protein [Salipaludibacillus agaradhaerens]
MAKQRFKIPTSLDVSYFDMEFNMKSKNGVGLNRPVSAKVIVFALIAAFVWFYLVFQTFIGKGGIPVILGFTIMWIALSALLVRADNTNRTGLELVFSMINYLPKNGRYVPVRMSDSVYPLQHLLNIKTVDPEDGRIHFLDGQVGHCYHIVGSASALMFEQDKQIILDKVDSFYRKLPVGIEVIYDTVYEGHSVDDQLQAVSETKRDLNVQSPGLNALLKEQHDILKYAINNNQGLTSLHQYLVVRAPSEMALTEFENLLIGDVEGDGLMFRLAKTLNYKETTRYLKYLLGAQS